MIHAAIVLAFSSGISCSDISNLRFAPENIPKNARYVILMKDGIQVPAFLFESVYRGIAVKQSSNSITGIFQKEFIKRMQAISTIEAIDIDDESIYPHADWYMDSLDQCGTALDGKYTSIFNGDGTHIYIIDTGLTEYSESSFRVGDSYGIHGDTVGHGTMVASVLNKVVPMAIIHPVNIVPLSGKARISNFVHGVNWTIENIEKNGLINKSIILITVSSNRISSAINSVICKAVSKGINVVVSGGERACEESPSSLNDVISVGGIDGKGNVHDNECNDIYSPSFDIPARGPSGRKQVSEGTSFGAAIVSGVASICIQRGKDVSPCLIGNAWGEESKKIVYISEECR